MTQCHVTPGVISCYLPSGVIKNDSINHMLYLSLSSSLHQPRVTVAQGTALAASARAYHLPVGSSCLPCQHNTAPRYLTTQLQQASNVGYRQRLRSSSSAKLDVPRTKHVTIGGHAFSSTAARVWNGLPTAVQSSESLDIFRRCLKTELFERSYN